MRKKTLKKYIPFLVSSALALSGIIILACAGGDDLGNYPPSFFAPETIHSDKYYPFFRSFFPLYEANRKYDYTEDFDNINVTEWDGYFQQTVTKKDLNQILYKARVGEIDTLIFTIKKPDFAISNNLKNNSILKVADTRKALDFLYYMGFAKRCEPYASYIPDMWGDYNADDRDKNRIKDSTAIAKLQDGGVKQITNANSDFVKQRYIFQLIRLYYLSGNYDKCIQFYTAQKSLLETNANSIKYRAMGYAAGAYYKQKQYANANYFYSLIYTQYDTMKLAAYFSFHPQNESDWNQTLAMAKNNNEKIGFWHMLGVYVDPFRAMKEIYALDPKSEMLDLLLVRAVNLEEENPFCPVDSGWYLNDLSVTKDLLAFIKTVADKGNTHVPYEWDMAAGYSARLVNDNSYTKYLNKAAKESNDSLVRQQIRLIQIVDRVSKLQAEDSKAEESIVPDLKWLQKGKHDQYLRTDVAFTTVIAILASKYQQNDYDETDECFLRPEYNGNNPMLDYPDDFLNRLIVFIDKPDKTEFEKYALSVAQFNKTGIIALQAARLIYQYDFAGAEERLKQIPPDPKGSGDELYGDPFVIHIKDCHDCDASNPKKDKYTELSFVQKMIKLKAKLLSDPSDANTCFLLANAYYNMTYYGNNRVLYGGYIRPDMSCDTAQAYYVKAMNASKDVEFKAKCCFMASKCELNTYYNNGELSGNVDFKAGNYFAALKSNYSNTKYYQEVIAECGYFKTYVSKGK